MSASFRHISVAFAALAAGLACADSGAPLLVADGRAVSEIVSGERRAVPDATRYAAEELQRWIGEMTDAYIPIRRADEPPRADIRTRVVIKCIGRDSPFAADFKAIGDTDGFAVRTLAASNGVAEIYIVARQERGLLHRVVIFVNGGLAECGVLSVESGVLVSF